QPSIPPHASSYLIHRHNHHPSLHSFPTRRSSDLFVAHTYYWGDVHLKNLGEERGRRISSAKSAFDRGLIVNFHQDSPVVKPLMLDRKSTRLNSSHVSISYAVFCLKKKNTYKH